mgnify:CR=1 FL=1
MTVALRIEPISPIPAASNPSAVTLAKCAACWSGDILPFENKDYIINRAKINNEILNEKFNYQDKTILDNKIIKNKELSILTTAKNKKDINLILKLRKIINQASKNTNVKLDTKALDINTLMFFGQLKSTTVKKIIYSTDDKIKELFDTLLVLSKENSTPSKSVIR